MDADDVRRQLRIGDLGFRWPTRLDRLLDSPPGASTHGPAKGRHEVATVGHGDYRGSASPAIRSPSAFKCTAAPPSVSSIWRVVRK